MFAEVEQRLIKNKATLDVVEMYTSASSFTDLIGSLRQRVDRDEELLSCFNELRRELNIISNDNVDLTVFKKVISGYSKLVSVLEELSEKSPLTPTTATPDTTNTTDTSNNTTTTATSDTTATTATTDNTATTDTTVIDTSATETSRDPPSLDTLQATYFTSTGLLHVHVSIIINLIVTFIMKITPTVHIVKPVSRDMETVLCRLSCLQF